MKLLWYAAPFSPSFYHSFQLFSTCRFELLTTVLETKIVEVLVFNSITEVKSDMLRNRVVIGVVKGTLEDDLLKKTCGLALLLEFLHYNKGPR